MSAEIITRAEARAQGLTRYFTGKPCKRGHIADRFVSSSACVACTQKLQNERAAKPGEARERHLARRRALAKTDAARKADRRWKTANIERVRKHGRLFNRRKKYGLTEADFDALVAAHGGRCAICDTDKPGGRYGRFCVDHCHQTGRIRGILCPQCNMALGQLGDSQDAIMVVLE